MRSRTFDMIICALFAGLIAVGAFIRIPLGPLPFTLQDLFVLLAGLLLGGKRGAVSVLVYIFMGLIGLPVFTQGGGIAYVLKPSFGYIIGFAVAAYVTGKIANKTPAPSYKRLFAACFAGLGVIYLLGMIYYYLISAFYLGQPIGLWPLFLYCFLMTIPGDIILTAAAVLISKRLMPVIAKR